MNLFFLTAHFLVHIPSHTKRGREIESAQFHLKVANNSKFEIVSKSFINPNI